MAQRLSAAISALKRMRALEAVCDTASLAPEVTKVSFSAACFYNDKHLQLLSVVVSDTTISAEVDCCRIPGTSVRELSD